MYNTYIKPYLSLIKLAAGVALAATLWINGCSYGQSKSEAQIVRLENDISILRTANRSWAIAAEEVKRQAERNAAESRRLQELANKNADELADGREDRDRTISNNQSKLEAAIRNPKCNELLEMKLCPSVPLP